jgi:hypothetical protein
MHRVYTNNLLKHYQFAFTPMKGITAGAITVKEFVEEGLREGLVTIFVSLGVKGAFDATW